MIIKCDFLVKHNVQILLIILNVKNIEALGVRTKAEQDLGHKIPGSSSRFVREPWQKAEGIPNLKEGVRYKV
jgi:hypothetical protein